MVTPDGLRVLLLAPQALPHLILRSHEIDPLIPWEHLALLESLVMEFGERGHLFAVLCLISKSRHIPSLPAYRIVDNTEQKLSVPRFIPRVVHAQDPLLPVP